MLLNLGIRGEHCRLLWFVVLLWNSCRDTTNRAFRARTVLAFWVRSSAVLLSGAEQDVKVKEEQACMAAGSRRCQTSRQTRAVATNIWLVARHRMGLPGVFNGLFTRWIGEIKKDLGNVSSGLPDYNGKYLDWRPPNGRWYISSDYKIYVNICVCLFFLIQKNKFNVASYREFRRQILIRPGIVSFSFSALRMTTETPIWVKCYNKDVCGCICAH